MENIILLKKISGKKIVMQQKTEHKHCIIKFVDGNMEETNIETDDHNDFT